MRAPLLPASARRAAIGVVVLLGVAFSCEAFAAGNSGAQWYVELNGTTCQAQRTVFEREIALACAAVGNTCRVVTAPKDAELRAILECGADESWTLETRTVEGAVIGKVELAGTTADRLREAAVEVARDAAPERALAIETLRFTLANEEPARLKNGNEKLTVVLGGRATGVTGGSAPPSGVASARGGAHLIGGLALTKAVRFTAGLVGEAGGSQEKAMRELRGGPGIALGAPFDPTAPIGVAAEVGLAATTQYGLAARDGGGVMTSRTTIAGYGQGTLTVQWPRDGVRPYAAMSAAFMSDGARFLASGEAGLAFAIF